MKEYKCKSCENEDLFIEERGNQTALLCGKCGLWQKWVSRKELPLVKRFIESNKDKK